MFAVRLKGTGLWWCGRDRWSTDPQLALTRTHDDDMFAVAFCDCPAHFTEWDVAPVPPVREAMHA